MKAPNKIYCGNNGNGNLSYSSQPFLDAKEYIREDVAELTWEDIRQLFRIADNYESELVRPKYLSEEYCKEVLRRFLKSKKEIEL